MTDTTTYREQGRALFLAAIMVISMVAVGAAFAAPAAATTLDTADRTLDADEVEPGETVEITISGEFDGETQVLTISDSFDPEFVDVSFVSYSIDGEDVSIADPTITEFQDDGVDFVHDGNGESIGETSYELVYEVEVVDEEATHDLTNGTVTATDMDDESNTIDLEDASITVAEADDGEEDDDADEEVDERDADRNFGTVADLEGSLVYSGQTVSVGVDGQSLEAGDEVQLRRSTGDDSSTTASLLTVQDDDDGLFVQFNTADRQTDDYFLRGGDITRADSEFEVVTQDLSTEFDEEEVDNGGSDVYNELEIDSDLRNTYDVWLTIDGFDEAEDFEFILENSDLDIDDAWFDEDEEAVYIENAEGTHDINFTDVDAGDYEFEFEVTDSDAEDTAEVTVNDVDDGEVGFDEAFVTEDQGDLAEITLTFSGEADAAYLRIGDEDDVGYEANISVDADGEDEVTLLFNTYAAGSADYDDDEIVSIEDDDSDAEITSFEQTTVSGILDTGDYGLELDATSFDEIADDNSDTVGDLVIEERSTNNFDLWTTSADVFENVEDAEDDDGDGADTILDAVGDDNVVTADTLASGDVLIHELGATGLEGLFEVGTEDSLADADGLAGALTAQDSEDGIDLRIRQTAASTGPNQERKVVDVGAMLDDITVIEGDDTYFIAFDANDIELQGDRELEDGDEFDVRLRIKDERLLNVDEDELDDADGDLSDFYEVVTATFTYEDAEGEFDEPVEVNNDDEQTISGTSNVAPGQEFNIRVRSASGVSPGFVLTAEDVTTQADGTWSADFDFSDTSVDDEFTVRVRQSTFDIDDADGTVVEVEEEETEEPETEEPETEEPETEEPETEEPETEEPETEEPETETPDDTDDDTPGFGAVVALVALLAAALLATRRRP